MPVLSADRVAKLVLGLVERWYDGMSARLHEVNGAPGVLVLDGRGAVDSVLAFTIADGRVTEVDICVTRKSSAT